MSRDKFVIGIDFGTDSVRSIIVNAFDGEQISSSVCEYPRWKKGMYCDPVKNRFRQHPLDYIEAMETSIKEAVASAPNGVARRIVGIGIDTTGSTPAPVDRNGVVLALRDDFRENPNAMFLLWKDHTAVEEAEEINNLAHNWGGEDYTKYEGGVYSAEWFWSKILHIVRRDEEVRNAAFSWMEHCDWMTALLTGNQDPLKAMRSRCAAGHKAMWHQSWGGLPPKDFLVRLDPVLGELRGRLYTETYTSDHKAGSLSPEWAERLGLDKSVSVNVAAIDAHMGAVGAEIEPYHLCKVMGTSTCDMMVVPKEEVNGKIVKGICGQVDGSIIPGMIGMEAGQSAFGDVYSWFRGLLMFPVTHVLKESGLLDYEMKKKVEKEIFHNTIGVLSKEAENIPDSESGIVALDWLNGRRTPDANQFLKSAIAGLTLGSDAPRIFRALVEATSFGAKRIVDRFISEGIEIKGVIALGGVSKKSPFVMQVVSDVLNMKIRVASSDQTTAIGSAMAAATAAGLYPRIEDAQKAMGCGFEKEYCPDPQTVEKYKILYERYLRLGEFVEKECKDNI